MYVEFPGIDLLHRLSESVELLDIGFVAIALQRMDTSIPVLVIRYRLRSLELKADDGIVILYCRIAEDALIGRVPLHLNKQK